jgi:hypothetical protein
MATRFTLKKILVKGGGKWALSLIHCIFSLVVSFFFSEVNLLEESCYSLLVWLGWFVAGL